MYVCMQAPVRISEPLTKIGTHVVTAIDMASSHMNSVDITENIALKST